MNKNKNFFIQLDALEPDSANTMRVLSYARGFKKLGIKVTLLVSLPSPIKLMLEGVDVIDIYNGTYKRQNKIQQNILFYKAIKKNVKAGDCIIFCGAPLYGLLLNDKIIKIAEETEIPLHGNTKNIALKLLSRVRNYSLFSFNGLLVISQALKSYYLDKGFPRERLFISNMMVDSSRFDNIVKEECDEIYVAYCGSISNAKDGVDTLIRSFAVVHKRLPFLKLYLAGNFASKIDEEEDKKLISQYGLKEVVKLVGLVNSKDMPLFLKNAKSLVLARPDNRQALYGFPTKLGEYLLTGNPVVVTGVGDIPLFLENNENCYMAAPDDIEDIADKIMQSVTDENAANIGNNGKAVALKYFDGMNVAKDVAAFIETLL